VVERILGRPEAAVAPASRTAPAAESAAPTAERPREEPLAGLDLGRLKIEPEGVTAWAAGGRAVPLTLDPTLQRTAMQLLRVHRFPEAAVVMLDPESGEVLAYASYMDGAGPVDLASQTSAPAASLFKIVTAASLVSNARATPETKQCYSGGEHKILAADLVDDPHRDRWCATLGTAMGRSLNTVFARLAHRNLAPAQLEETAHSLGFSRPIPFDVQVEPSAVRIPKEPLGFARTAAGFWNSSMSPLHAAWLTAVIAREGAPLRPRIVRGATSSSPVADDTVTMSKEVARALGRMLEHTVSEGTSYRAFHDPSGRTFLPGMQVAGKTGTLTEPDTKRLVTWFVGYAPSRPVPGVRQVALAVLVINRPKWQMKANTLARELFRAHFAAHDTPGVTRPVASLVSQRYEGRSKPRTR
jgi:cell division protein FtsI/penicillin-binding protein 2